MLQQILARMHSGKEFLALCRHNGWIMKASIIHTRKRYIHHTGLNASQALQKLASLNSIDIYARNSLIIRHFRSTALHAPQVRKRQITAASAPARRALVARRPEAHILHEQRHVWVIRIWT